LSEHIGSHKHSSARSTPKSKNILASAVKSSAKKVSGKSSVVSKGGKQSARKQSANKLGSVQEASPKAEEDLIEIESDNIVGNPHFEMEVSEIPKVIEQLQVF
jgi:hypothetical protein